MGFPNSTSSKPRALTVAEWFTNWSAGIQPHHTDLKAVSHVSGQSLAAPGLLPISPGVWYLWDPQALWLFWVHSKCSLSNSPSESISSRGRVLQSADSAPGCHSSAEASFSFPGSRSTEMQSPPFILPVLHWYFQ